MKSSIYRIANRDEVANLGLKLKSDSDNSMIDFDFIPVNSSYHACNAALRKYPSQQLFAIYTSNSAWKKVAYKSQIKAGLKKFRPYHQIWNGPGVPIHITPAYNFKPSSSALLK